MSERLQTLWEKYRIYVIGAAIALVAAVGVAAKAFEQPAPVVAEPVMTATPVPEDIVVDVEGAVNVPGVHRLPAGSLLDDALAAAGGLMPEADLDRVARELNRADKLKPNQKVYVPFVGERVLALSGGTGADSVSGSSADDAPGGLVDLNTATTAELEKLPGVGPSTAAKIIAYREQNGGFGSVEELLEVSGIGEAKFEQVKDLVTV